MKNEKPLTTGDIARFCSVTVATVCNWVKAGKLKVFVTPGGQYRMERFKFLDFLKENGFPIPKDFIHATCRVLTVDVSHETAQAIRQALAGKERNIEIDEAANPYEALVKIGRISPNYLVFSAQQDSADLPRVVRFLKECPETRDILLVVINAEPGSEVFKHADVKLSSPLDDTKLYQIFFRNSA
jgi:hypothetical protein